MMSAFWPLALFFTFSALAFGCMEGWAVATCEVILLLGAALVGWNNQQFWAIPKRLRLPALLVVVLILIGLIQLVPLPASWWAAAGSERYTRYTEGAEAERLIHTDTYRRDPFGPEAEKPLPSENWTPLTPPVPKWIPATFTPAATGRALLALAAGLCLILLLEQLADGDRRWLNRLAWLVGGLGFATAFIALLAKATKPTTILGIRPSARAGVAFGAFVNPNHGAAFAGLASCLLLALLWERSRRFARSTDRNGFRLLGLSAFALVAASIAAGHSRAAILPVALLPLAWLFHRGATGARWASRAGIAAALIMLAFALFARHEGFASDHGRLELAANVPLRAAVLGCGIGSFQERFPAEWRNLARLSPVRNTHLENEYAQAFFEGGAIPLSIALAIGISAAIGALSLTLRGSPMFWIAPALIGAVFQAAVDFTSHVFPIVGVFLLLLLIARLSNLSPEDSTLRIATSTRVRARHTTRIIPAILLVLGLCVPFVANVNSELTPPFFAQGALIPLVTAERLCDQGRAELALESFSLALRRAERDGWETVAARVRNRIGCEGKRLLPISNGVAWRFLSNYCILAPDFSVASRQMEAWILDRGGGPVFAYPVVIPGGDRIAYGSRGEQAPIWFWRRQAPQKTLPWLYNHHAGDLPASGGNYAWVHQFALAAGPSAVPLRARISCPGGDKYQWYLSMNNIVPWTTPMSQVSPGVWEVTLRPTFRWGIDRLVTVGPNRRPKFSMELIHTYEAVP